MLIFFKQISFRHRRRHSSFRFDNQQKGLFDFQLKNLHECGGWLFAIALN